jgi:DNA-binding transcriptional regulator YdaS (Cro superfamily)
MKLQAYLEESPRGTATKLAADMGISPSYLSQMASGEAPISPKRGVEFEQRTNGAVTRQEMFEDWASIWPELVDANSGSGVVISGVG